MKKFWLTVLSLLIFAGGAWGIVTLGQNHLGHNARATVASSATKSSRSVSSSSKRRTKTQVKQTIKYAALGDGIASGTGASVSRNAYQYLLAANMRKKLNAKVVLSGQWNTDGTVKGSALPVLNHVLSSKPDLVTIQYGNSEQNSSNLYAATTAEYQTNLTTLVQDIKQQSPKTHIVVLSPWQSASENAFAAVAKSVAATNGAQFVDLSSVFNSSTNVAANSYPNDAGNAAIAQLILNKVVKDF